MEVDEVDEVRALVARVGTFSLRLIPRAERHYDETAALVAHDTVLRPLLQIATECWSYSVDTNGDVFRCAGEILEPKRGKSRVCLDGDPVTGRELFWNAKAGRRGTIVMLIPITAFIAADIFRACHDVFVASNFLSAHTPAAVRFARQAVCAASVVAVCLPRNNGIEWIDIYVEPAQALRLYELSEFRCPARYADR